MSQESLAIRIPEHDDRSRRRGRALGSYITTSPGRMCGPIDPDVTVTGRQPIDLRDGEPEHDRAEQGRQSGRDGDQEQDRAAHKVSRRAARLARRAVSQVGRRIGRPVGVALNLALPTCSRPSPSSTGRCCRSAP